MNRDRIKKICGISLIVIAILLLAAGAVRGDLTGILQKGSMICLECIGLE